MNKNSRRHSSLPLLKVIPFKHIFGETNFTTDSLAKLGHSY